MLGIEWSIYSFKFDHEYIVHIVELWAHFWNLAFVLVDGLWLKEERLELYFVWWRLINICLSIAFPFIRCRQVTKSHRYYVPHLEFPFKNMNFRTRPIRELNWPYCSLLTNSLQQWTNLEFIDLTVSLSFYNCEYKHGIDCIS